MNFMKTMLILGRVASNYFYKTAPSQMFARVLNMSLLENILENNGRIIDQELQVPFILIIIQLNGSYN